MEKFKGKCNCLSATYRKARTKVCGLQTERKIK